MITSVDINGFKSLNNFKISLRKGLNILVGPNGSGKTNIVSFFEFISYLIQRDLHEAVSLCGGAGSIFRKIGENDFEKNISAIINGTKELPDKKFLIFQYKFEIEASINKGLIYFKKQELRFLFSDKEIILSDTNQNKLQWDFSLTHSLDKNFKPQSNFEAYNPKKIQHTWNSELKREQLKDYILDRVSRVGSRTLIQYLFRVITSIDFIYIDLLGGESFNIIPSKVKLPEDIAKSPGIQKDGSGLAVTLFAIKNKQTQKFNPIFNSLGYFIENTFSPELYSKIIELTKLANPSIESIDIVNNPFDNQLLVKLSIRTQKDNIVLPLASMSDGTIKWITLITAILTSSQIFSIEEPENFLHPWMQQEIVEIMRNTHERKNQDSFILLSTHSETLLNSAKPEEIIVVSMENGISVAVPIKNPQQLNELISRTGFGLGFYYISNTFSNE